MWLLRASGTTRGRAARLAWSLLLALGTLFYLRWLDPAIAPYAGGSDPSGYMWSARLFRHGTLSVPLNIPPRFPLDIVGVDVLTPLGANVRPGTLALVAGYPTGLPLHIAAASLLLDEERAVKAVLILAAAGTLGLLYLLGRAAGLRPLWAAAGCVLLACSPLFLFMAVQPYSDVLATLWVEAAILCAWHSRRTPALALLAGASLGVATLVRPTNLLFLLPVLLAMPLGARSCAQLVLGGFPFAVFLTVYQAWAYGHPLRTGYGDMSPAFAWSNVLPSLKHYAVWLPQLASWLIVLIPLAAWAWRGPLVRWIRVAAAWLTVNLGTYAFYYHTWQSWWFLRFVLPAFPILIVGALVALQRLTSTLASGFRLRSARLLPTAAAVVVVGLSVAALARHPLFSVHRTMKASERVYPDALKMMKIHGLSSTPVLMMQMSGAANYYEPQMYLLRYDLLSPEAWQAIRRWQASEGVAVGAALFEFELDALFRSRAGVLPCDWQSQGRYQRVTFWTCPPEAQRNDP